MYLLSKKKKKVFDIHPIIITATNPQSSLRILGSSV